MTLLQMIGDRNVLVKYFCAQRKMLVAHGNFAHATEKREPVKGARTSPLLGGAGVVYAPKVPSSA